MYSPKIREEYIPYIYKLGRHTGKPMTHIVNEIIGAVIDKIRTTDLFEELEAEEALIKELTEHITRLARSRKREERNKIIELFKKIA
jgi:hypothetical protein